MCQLSCCNADIFVILNALWVILGDFEDTTLLGESSNVSVLESLQLLISPLIILTLLWKKGWFLLIVELLEVLLLPLCLQIHAFVLKCYF
jgi:hypothetical protein